MKPKTLASLEAIEPLHFADQLDSGKYLILDVSSSSTYRRMHLPKAQHIAPRELMRGIPPASGLLPSMTHLGRVFARVGYEKDRPVLVYDDEGGGWAGRLIWTLDLLGHQNMAFLDGGLYAWSAARLPLSRTVATVQKTTPDVGVVNPFVRATIEEVLAGLNSDMVLWDARSAEEYSGERQLALRAGHIPGAIHLEWTDVIDHHRQLRIRKDLADLLERSGLGRTRQIVTYCHSHHRSGLTYLAARLLGYPFIRAYDGSWSQWGNRYDTPIQSSSNRQNQP